MSKKFIKIKYLFPFLLIGFVLTNIVSYSLAQESIKTPEDLKEAEEMGKKFLWGFPEALKKPWEEALALWKNMASWFRGFWNSYVFPWFQSIWYRINSFLGREVEKRKPEIKEEFEKEKQEMKEDIPKTGKSLWQRFKELIK